MARKEGKDRGITQRKGREGWWVRVYEEGTPDVAQVRHKKPSTHAVWEVEGRCTRGKTLSKREDDEIDSAERLLRDVAQEPTGTRQEGYDHQDVRVAIAKTCPPRLRDFATLRYLTTTDQSMGRRAA
jgi:hypothetical protein